MVRAALSFKLLEAFAAPSRQPGKSGRAATGTTQRSQAALRETLLVSAQRTDRITERLSHIVLIGPAQLDQAHHGVGFGHAIIGRILGDGHP